MQSRPALRFMQGCANCASVNVYVRTVWAGDTILLNQNSCTVHALSTAMTLEPGWNVQCIWMECTNHLDGVFDASGWSFRCIWMESAMHLDGVYNASGWSIHRSWTEYTLHLDGIYNACNALESGWSLQCIWMESTTHLDGVYTDSGRSIHCIWMESTMHAVLWSLDGVCNASEVWMESTFHLAKAVSCCLFVNEHCILHLTTTSRKQPCGTKNLSEFLGWR
ncbi:hypothetical protein DUNSADRAFT_4918 [Dunaliella salina]|uniref:Encoded protein n=1 Tax=Dunaliella salina TaxID=3046 RepID=A0ABQ7GR39_DUNSA|nr:hypothetical protein DUNSADRAFT_4918 [Dunaliella salina]|eukprot:KAF5837038.1 hypothetical protein DUNSADRAFT_4918 [Dunaliella salina]